jgi:hypothetical protein
MGTYTTHVRIPVDQWRESLDTDALATHTERKVRTTLRGAQADPEAEVKIWWYVIIPGQDPTAHEGSTEDAPYGRGEVSMNWQPGEPIPDGTGEIVCRGHSVT